MIEIADQGDLARFFSKISKQQSCWEWTGCRDKDGYGFLMFDGRRGQKAHRVAYRLVHGEIPSGLLVCHKCDNPPCVRPSHLFAGTPKQNAEDAAAKGRMAKGALNGANTRPERRPMGIEHGRSKLTADAVREIRAMAESGIQHQTIADQFGVVQTCITKIVNRLAWRHVA